MLWGFTAEQIAMIMGGIATAATAIGGLVLSILNSRAAAAETRRRQEAERQKQDFDQRSERQKQDSEQASSVISQYRTLAQDIEEHRRQAIKDSEEKAGQILALQKETVKLSNLHEECEERSKAQQGEIDALKSGIKEANSVATEAKLRANLAENKVAVLGARVAALSNRTEKLSDQNSDQQHHLEQLDDVVKGQTPPTTP